MCDKTSFILEFFQRNLDKVVNWLSKDKVLCCPDKEFLWNLCEFFFPRFFIIEQCGFGIGKK